MEKQRLTVAGIPAILWGPASQNLFIAVHGDASNKEDDVIKILAEEAAAKGQRTLSFDLPEHGGRKQNSQLCKVQNCVAELNSIVEYARTISEEISLFGCSIGAYFGMMAYRNQPLRQALFLSPVVDMRRIIENMMTWFSVSKERLELEQVVQTPLKTLYWDYYRYVVDHPVEWCHPTALLCGEKDELCEPDVVKQFAEQIDAKMTVLQEGEHHFHTQPQLIFYRQWLRDNIHAE